LVNINGIIHGRCENILKCIDSNIIDLCLTSPPYDSLRSYNSIFDIDSITKELFRVISIGGVVVWNVMDETINGSESGTSFRQALKFMDAGFKLHDTMIYEKNSPAYPANRNGNRYTGIFEYMFVFSKGKPRVANLICDKKNKFAGEELFSKKGLNGDGKIVSEFSPRTNIWRYVTSQGSDTGEHSAVFPEQLAIDHIKTWTNENDLVLDIFSGSGTTCDMASRLNRNFIGCEIDKKWVEHAKKRIGKNSGVFGKKLDLSIENSGYFSFEDIDLF